MIKPYFVLIGYGIYLAIVLLGIATITYYFIIKPSKQHNMADLKRVINVGLKVGYNFLNPHQRACNIKNIEPDHVIIDKEDYDTLISFFQDPDNFMKLREHIIQTLK